ncbi:hypothetical protein ACNQUF_11965 [Corynebacterium diphtheriae]
MTRCRAGFSGAPQGWRVRRRHHGGGLCGDVVARARRRPGRPWRPAGQPVVLLMASFLLIYLAGITVQTFSGQAMFERYLYPLIVP